MSRRAWSCFAIIAAVLLLAVLAVLWLRREGRGGMDLLSLLKDSPPAAEIERVEAVLAEVPGIDKYSLKVIREGEQYWAFYDKKPSSGALTDSAGQAKGGGLFCAEFSLDQHKLAGEWREERISAAPCGFMHMYFHADTLEGQPYIVYRDSERDYCFMARRQPGTAGRPGSWAQLPLPEIRTPLGLAASAETGQLYLLHRSSDSKLLRLLCIPLDGLGDSSRRVEGNVLMDSLAFGDLLLTQDGLPLLAFGRKAGGIVVLESDKAVPSGPEDWMNQGTLLAEERILFVNAATVADQPVLCFSSGERQDLHVAIPPDWNAAAGSATEWMPQRIFIGRLGGTVRGLCELDGKPCIYWSDAGDLLVMATQAQPTELEHWCAAAVRPGTLALPSGQPIGEGGTLRVFWVDGEKISLISYPSAPRPRDAGRSLPQRLEDRRELLNEDLLEKAMDSRSQAAGGKRHDGGTQTAGHQGEASNESGGTGQGEPQ